MVCVFTWIHHSIRQEEEADGRCQGGVKKCPNAANSIVCVVAILLCQYYCGYCGPVACKNLRGDNMRVSVIICECQLGGLCGWKIRPSRLIGLLKVDQLNFCRSS